MTAWGLHHVHGSRMVRALHASLTLCGDMIIRIRSVIVSGVLLLTAGFGAAGNAQMGPAPGGPGGPGGMGGPAPGGPPRGPGPGNMGPGPAGREFGPPPNFRSPSSQDWPIGSPRSPSSTTPSETIPDASKSVPLSDVVSMVQQQFNATAVKADTVREDGQLVYRIRLLSADKSRVWTVNVDARTGLVR